MTTRSPEFATMVLILNPWATQQDIDHLTHLVEEKALEWALHPGEVRNQIHVLGDLSHETEAFWRTQPGVQQVYGLAKPYKLANKTHREVDHPDSHRQPAARQQGSRHLRRPLRARERGTGYGLGLDAARHGPRDHAGVRLQAAHLALFLPGSRVEGLHILKRIRECTGMLVETEVMDVRDVQIAAELVDVVRIGARNMQNFDLLKEMSRVETPVILKRGASNTIRESLLAAEYILQGNPNVILCERGIRSFETAYRNTLDVGAIAVAETGNTPAGHCRSQPQRRKQDAGAGPVAGRRRRRCRRFAHRGASQSLGGAQRWRPVALSASVREPDGRLAEGRRGRGPAAGRTARGGLGAATSGERGGGGLRVTVCVPVETPGQDASYEIVVGATALDGLPAFLGERYSGRRIAAIGDAEALRLHGERLRAALPEASLCLEVPSGEDSKSRGQKARLEDELLSRRWAATR